MPCMLITAWSLCISFSRELNGLTLIATITPVAGMVAWEYFGEKKKNLLSTATAPTARGSAGKCYAKVLPACSTGW